MKSYLPVIVFGLLASKLESLNYFICENLGEIVLLIMPLKLRAINGRNLYMTWLYIFRAKNLIFRNGMQSIRAKLFWLRLTLSFEQFAHAFSFIHFSIVLWNSSWASERISVVQSVIFKCPYIDFFSLSCWSHSIKLFDSKKKNLVLYWWRDALNTFHAYAFCCGYVPETCEETDCFHLHLVNADNLACMLQFDDIQCRSSNDIIFIGSNSLSLSLSVLILFGADTNNKTRIGMPCISCTKIYHTQAHTVNCISIEKVLLTVEIHSIWYDTDTFYDILNCNTLCLAKYDVHSYFNQMATHSKEEFQVTNFYTHTHTQGLCRTTFYKDTHAFLCTFVHHLYDIGIVLIPEEYDENAKQCNIYWEEYAKHIHRNHQWCIRIITEQPFIKSSVWFCMVKFLYGIRSSA